MSLSRKFLLSILAVALASVAIMGLMAFGGGRAALEQLARDATGLEEIRRAQDGPDVQAAAEKLRLYLMFGGLVVLVIAGGVAVLVSRAVARQPEGETLEHAMREREQVEIALKESQEQLRNLSAHLEAAREGERKRIARDIHDDLGQALTTLKLDLSLLREDLQGHPPNFVQRLNGMSHLVDATIRSVKRLITELRPRLLDDLGLSAAIEWQAEEFQKHTGVPIELSIYPEEIIMDPDRSTALFRIFQETLANVSRHAEASAVWANLTEIDGVVELEVRDDGKGISGQQINDSRSFGLIGIRERAYSWGGEVDISGSPANGTRVRVRFTLPGEDG
jgi:signal transduction histidine kinase